MPSKYRYTFVNATSGTLQLTNEPLNWKSLKITFKRSKDFQGVTKNFTQDLSFWGDGNDYLRIVYDNTGVNSEVETTIEIFNLEIYSYEDLFVGRVNFSNYEEEINDKGLEVINTNLEPTLFEQQVVKGAGINIDVFKLEDRFGDAITPFTENEEVKPSLEGQQITNIYKSSEATVDQGFFPLIETYSNNAGTQFFNFSFSQSEDEDSVLDINLPTSIVLLSTPSRIWKVGTHGPATISYEIDFDLRIELSSGDFGGNSQVVTFFIFSKNFGRISFDIGGGTSPVFQSLSGNFTSTVSLTQTFDVGDEISFFADFKQVTVGGSDVEYDRFDFTINSFTFDITQTSAFQRTLPRGMFPFEMISRIVNFLTGEPDRVIGDIISKPDQDFNPQVTAGEASRVMTGSGLGFRNFPDDEAPLIVNLNDVFNSFSYGFNVGLGFVDFGGNETVIIEGMDFFYNDTVIMTISDGVKNPRMSLDSGEHWSSLMFGFSTYKIEDREIQSAQEFNTQRTYNSAVQIEDITKTILSPYIGGGYLIEYQRKKQWFDDPDQKNDERRYDESKFLLALTETTGETKTSSGVLNEGGTGGFLKEFMTASRNGSINFIYLIKEFTEISNEILYNNGEPGFIQTKLSQSLNSVTLGGQLNVPTDDINYTVDVSLVGIFQLITFSGTASFDSITFELRLGATTVDSQVFNNPSDGNQFSLNLTDNNTILIGGSDSFYELRIVYGIGAGDFEMSMSLRDEIIFSLTTDDSLQVYRQENFTDFYGGSVTVNDLINPDTALNSRISPRQSIERHKSILNAVNHRLTPDQLTFSGDPISNVLVNTTTPTFAENDDIDTSVDPLYENELLRIDVPWTLAESTLVDANRYGSIVIANPDISFEGYVEDIEHRVEENEASLTLKRKAGT